MTTEKKPRMTPKIKAAIRRREYDTKLVTVEIPGFALGALADKAQEWADSFDAKDQAQAAHDWYVVVKKLATAANNFNADRPQ